MIHCHTEQLALQLAVRVELLGAQPVEELGPLAKGAARRVQQDSIKGLTLKRGLLLAGGGCVRTRGIQTNALNENV